MTGPSGATKTLPVKSAGQGWTNLLGDGDPIMFRIGKYWPDFAMKDGAADNNLRSAAQSRRAGASHRPEQIAPARRAEAVRSADG